MAPLAANAADSATGPDALKLSTFKSRLEKQEQQTAPAQQKGPKGKPRVRAIPNTTAQLIATSYFFPLTARFQSAVRSTAGRARGIIFQPFLLSLYIRTLALLLHAAGPSTLALPDMTAELWGLLLGSSVQAQASGDLGVTHAVLFALLTMLEVNESRMRDVCQAMPREVVETQEWVAQIFGGIRGDDGGGEENDVRMLAAGVLIRIREGMEKYRALLMGEMIG
jgi:telomere length regulation protein